MEQSNITSIIGVVVAALAMFIATWNAYIQRKHARLSVTPHIDLTYGETTKDPLGLFMVNNGLGPARIKEFSVLVGGESVKPNYLGIWSAVFHKFNQTSPSEANDVTAGQMLRAGDMLLLVKVDHVGESVEEFVEKIGEFQSVLRQIEVRVSYESLYDVQYSATWRLK